MKTFRIEILIIAFIFSATLKNIGQEFEKDRFIWTSKTDLGQLVEGKFSLNASFSLELISFTDYVADFQYGLNEQLFVEFWSPYDTLFLMQGQEERIFRFYGIESKPSNAIKGKNKLGPWPVDLGLRDNEIRSSNLALLIKIKSFDFDLILPANLSSDLWTRPLGGNDHYKLVLRVKQSIDAGNWYLYKGFQGKKELLDSDAIATGFIPFRLEGSSLILSLPKSAMKEDPEGWYTLDLNYRLRGRRPMRYRRFFFYHNPN